MKTQTDIIEQAFDKRAKLIVSLYRKDLTLREIAERVGLTYQRVWQILQDQKIKGAK